MSGLNMIATRLSPGAISESNSSHLPPNESSKLAKPVTFPLGRSSRSTERHGGAGRAADAANPRHQPHVSRSSTRINWASYAVCHRTAAGLEQVGADGFGRRNALRPDAVERFLDAEARQAGDRP